MQTTTNRYILNLALADELYLLGKTLEDFLSYLPYYKYFVIKYITYIIKYIILKIFSFVLITM
jgi:hypothetical protein